ncbi:hypothetical protein EYF80_003928 [Liparis tanakae]|uniref:Uncharacterized protein n=1 Tax=Liparis tanakae TaxID=230148 RepID=A0A4Z2J6X5_9TELE|nr:hypothetical protein EYF80_003928 [Liparis tanakae]
MSRLADSLEVRKGLLTPHGPHDRATCTQGDCACRQPTSERPHPTRRHLSEGRMFPGHREQLLGASELLQTSGCPLSAIKRAGTARQSLQSQKHLGLFFIGQERSEGTSAGNKPICCKPHLDGIFLYDSCDATSVQFSSNARTRSVPRAMGFTTCFPLSPRARPRSHRAVNVEAPPSLGGRLTCDLLHAAEVSGQLLQHGCPAQGCLPIRISPPILNSLLPNRHQAAKHSEFLQLSSRSFKPTCSIAFCTTMSGPRALNLYNSFTILHLLP